ncbi:MarR family winged helix-turn-helix transcriptional regulator [Sphingomonas rubra]|uniref:DNA-binding transcriptional regulator, MarR family n=1 Tax=Sphingomonas rubra TaxID=634430 RepID=A0A1I5SGX7_9SPHN|nr:MarR family transcriptional regulator [Sphingomonas rubra]SFP69757.1 DNA-binding transcriptional regulator, MarR family [Sphingomonas rubra]
MGFYDESDFRPDRSIGYLVRRVHQLGIAGIESVFAAEGLTGTQWQALVSIWFGRGGTAAELARDLGHDKGAMTRLVDQLAERGWITRERTTEDRRCIRLVLTEEGVAVALRCKARVVACWNEWLADWPEGEVERLIDLLQKLRGTLAAAEVPCA